jgi:hypothetical protein
MPHLDALPIWIVLDELGGSAPVQGYGRVLEPPARFYFRSRHEHWSIGVSTNPELDPVDVFESGPDGFFHEEAFGQGPYDASYMPLDVARFFIVRELTRWRSCREGDEPSYQDEGSDHPS